MIGQVQIFQLDTFKRSWQCFLVFCFFLLFPKHVRAEAHWLKPKILTILKHSKNSQVLKWQKYIYICSPKTTRTANLPSLTGVCKQSCWTYCTRLLWDWPAVQQAAAAASWCLCVPQPCFPDLCLEQSFDIHPLMLEWKNTSLSQNIRRDFKTCKDTPDNHWTVDIQRDCLAAAQGS